MIQRLIYRALNQGIQAAVNDPSIIEDLFSGNYSLEKPEVDTIISAFADKATPNVIHGYARTDSQFPLYSIVLGNEREDEVYMNNLAGQVEDLDAEDFGADILSSLWVHDFLILTVTEHPDLTVYYYELAKAFLLAYPFGEEGDLFDIRISGMDLAPDPRFMPSHLFVRQLKFECSREFARTDLSSLRDKAFRISGIHIDKSGSPSDVGGVKTNVTTYGVDDDE